MDNGSALSPAADLSLPPVASNSLSPAPSHESSMPLPGMDNTAATLPPGVPDMNSQTMTPPGLDVPPVVNNGTPATTSASHAADLNLPAVPTEIKSGFLQDLPTLSSSKKPAA